jgi:CHASE3 domain sensor protein
MKENTKMFIIGVVSSLLAGLVVYYMLEKKEIEKDKK